MLETSNIIVLYFKPDSKIGNGVAAFNGWEESKKYPEVHDFIKCLVYWVAGTKLIFIMFLVVILLTGSLATKIWSVVALILSTMLDEKNHLALNVSDSELKRVYDLSVQDIKKVHATIDFQIQNTDTQITESTQVNDGIVSLKLHVSD